MNYLIKLNNNIYFAWAKLKIQEVELNNKNLAKIFEYYVCHQLSLKYERPFYLYQDIDPGFKEENNMTMQDTGIDACDLLHCIVQCKLYSGTISLRHCATTFACQNINKGAEGLLIRWPDIIIARNKDSKLSSYLSGHYSSRFIPEEFCKDEMIEFCKKCVYIKEHRDEDFILRPYQEEAIKLINDSCNSCISLPTGTGKNFIIIKSLRKGCKYLILVPRIILMEQISEEIKIHRPELYAYVQLIGTGHKKYDFKSLIIIACYNSIYQITDLASFDKIFIDEAHHIYPPNIYRKENLLCEDKDNRSVDNFEDEDNSSTDNCEDEDNSSVDEDDDICDDLDDLDDVIIYDNDAISTDIETQSGDLLLYKEFDQSHIKKIKGISKNVVCLSATIDDIPGYKKYACDIRQMITDKYLCDYVIDVPLLSNTHATCEYLLRKYTSIIIFCSNRIEGLEITTLLNSLQPNSAKYVDWCTDKSDRITTLSEFKSGKLSFLINIRILTEGFDAPICKGVCFMHMPKSNTMILQIIGRCLRMHSSKVIANVILPFIQEDDGPAIKSFLQVIAKNDSRIKQSHDAKKLGGYINILQGDKESLEDNADDIFNYEYKFDFIYKSLGCFILSIEAWHARLEEIKEYIDEHNKLPSYTDTIEYIKTLARWTGTQKKSFPKHLYIMRNEDIRQAWNDFITSERYNIYFIDTEEKWQQKLCQLKLYIDTNKKRPNRDCTSSEDKKLGKWLSHQITNYEKNKNSMLQGNNRKTFELFKTSCEYSSYFITYEEKWDKNFALLTEYLIVNKKRPAQQSSDKNACKLGAWISMQLKHFSKKERIFKNSKYIDIWSSFINSDTFGHYFWEREEIWFRHFESAKKYIDTFKKRPPVSDSDQEIKQLGKWISSQSINYKKNVQIMTTDVIKKKWESFINDEKYCDYFLSNEEKWYMMFDKLNKYMIFNGMKPSHSANDEDVRGLAQWLTKQNKAYKNIEGLMKNQVILNKWVDFIKTEIYCLNVLSKEDKWKQNLEDVCKYINVNKKCPIDYLNTWLSKQKKNYKNNEGLMKNKIISDQWKFFIEDIKYSQYLHSTVEKWYIKLNNVKCYIDANHKRPSSTDINPDVKKLGEWYNKQSNNFTKQKEGMKDISISHAWSTFINTTEYADFLLSEIDLWYKYLKDTRNYIDTFDKRPSSSDLDINIKKLGSWIILQISNYKNNKGIVHKHKAEWTEFITTYSKFFIEEEDKWYEKLQELKEYIIIHKKLPSNSSKIIEVKKLAGWIQHQKSDIKKSKGLIAKNDVVKASWASFITDPMFINYFQTVDIIWYKTLENIENYIEKYNKRPSSKDKNDEIKNLGVWLVSQKKNYDNNKSCMKNDLIKTTWTTFISDPKYAHLFKAKI